MHVRYINCRSREIRWFSGRSHPTLAKALKEENVRRICVIKRIIHIRIHIMYIMHLTSIDSSPVSQVFALPRYTFPIVNLYFKCHHGRCQTKVRNILGRSPEGVLVRYGYEWRMWHVPDMGMMRFRLIASPPKKIQLLLLRDLCVRMQAGKRGDVITGCSSSA
jgi:hypothetical protein